MREAGAVLMPAAGAAAWTLHGFNISQTGPRTGIRVQCVGLEGLGLSGSGFGQKKSGPLSVDGFAMSPRESHKHSRNRLTAPECWRG